MRAPDRSKQDPLAGWRGCYSRVLQGADQQCPAGHAGLWKGPHMPGGAAGGGHNDCRPGSHRAGPG